MKLKNAKEARNETEKYYTNEVVNNIKNDIIKEINDSIDSGTFYVIIRLAHNAKQSKSLNNIINELKYSGYTIIKDVNSFENDLRIEWGETQ